MAGAVKYTTYFETMRSRPDRREIKKEWIQRVIAGAEREEIQTDGRIRPWARIAEAEGRALRVVLLPDGETLHNRFFDRGFKP